MSRKSIILKCFNKIGTVKEYLKFMHETTQSIKLMDCVMFEASSETEKAWCFDWSELYKQGECGKRFYYAPKSACKEIKNDHYVNADGTLVNNVKFILMPDWVGSRIGSW